MVAARRGGRRKTAPSAPLLRRPPGRIYLRQMPHWGTIRLQSPIDVNDVLYYSVQINQLIKSSFELYSVPHFFSCSSNTATGS